VKLRRVSQACAQLTQRNKRWQPGKQLVRVKIVHVLKRDRQRHPVERQRQLRRHACHDLVKVVEINGQRLALQQWPRPTRCRAATQISQHEDPKQVVLIALARLLLWPGTETAWGKMGTNRRVGPLSYPDPAAHLSADVLLACYLTTRAAVPSALQLKAISFEIIWLMTPAPPLIFLTKTESRLPL